MKAFLRLSSVFVIILTSCSFPYHKLAEQPVVTTSAFIYQPQYDKVLYRCTVNGRFVFKKFHLSGLLFFKTLENGTVRAIYQNEMGFTFFDFEWKTDDSFSVKQIIAELNKPALIKTLEKDMNLFLMKGLDKRSEKLLKEDRGNRLYNRFTLNKGYACYVTENGKLTGIENTGERKTVTTINIINKETNKAMPDSAFFDHHKAHFTIALHKIVSHVDE